MSDLRDKKEIEIYELLNELESINRLNQIYIGKVEDNQRDYNDKLTMLGDVIKQYIHNKEEI